MNAPSVPQHSPFQTASLAAQGWIAKHLPAAHRPNQPRATGALGRFRLNSERRGELATLLATHLARLPDPPGSLAGLFCLLAVQALRVRAAGQAWSWDTVEQALPARLRPMDQATMRALTEKGLRFWSRPLRTGTDGDRRFLHSLVLEAGIPDALLTRTEFQDFLRRLLRDADRYGATTAEAIAALAEAHRHRLPAAWRQPETIALAAELLDALEPFRIVMREGPAALDARYPEWRAALPLDMSDDAAGRLVTALLTQARATAAPLRELPALCHRVLRRNRDGLWTQRLAPPDRGLLPRLMAMRPPFSWSGDRQPVRVRMAVEGTEIAVADSDGAGWAVRGLPVPTLAWPFEREVVAGFLVEGNEVERCLLPGGDALDNVPWVFQADEETSGQLRFVGSGSRATTDVPLFIAVKSEQGQFDIRSGSVEPRGDIVGTERHLYEVTGDVRWRVDGEAAALRLRTDGTRNPPQSIHVELHRPGWEVVAPLVSVGPPELPALRGGGRLLWRRRGEAWSELRSALPTGVCDLALVKEGEVLDQRRIIVLPEGAALQCRRVAAPNRYAVELNGLGAIAAAIPGVIPETSPAGFLFHLSFDGPPPAVVEVTTRHPDGLELRHRVRVPMPDGGFIDQAGKSFGAHATVTFADLDQVVARGGADDDAPKLQVRLTAPRTSALGGVVLGRVVGFVDDLPLRRLRPDLRRMHATADARDGEIALCVLRSGLPGPTIKLAAFDCDLALADEPPAVSLRDRAGRTVMPQPGAALAARRLAQPEDPPRQLARYDESRWLLPGDEWPGPWLLIGADALSGRVRPRVWSGSARSAGNNILACAAMIPEQHERDAAFHDALVALAAAPYADEAAPLWDFLDATLDAATDVSVACFDGLSRASEVPELLVHWLLRADERRLTHLAALEDELPFTWVLVPLTAWREAARSAKTYYERLGLNPGPILADQLDRIHALCPPALGGDWAAREVLGLPQRANMPADRNQARAMAPALVKLAGPAPDEQTWADEVLRTRDWNNLPSLIRDGAPHIAARCAVDNQILPSRLTAAVRFCRHESPDEFDSRYLMATFARMAIGMGEAVR